MNVSWVFPVFPRVFPRVFPVRYLTVWVLLEPRELSRFLPLEGKGWVSGDGQTLKVGLKCDGLEFLLCFHPGTVESRIAQFSRSKNVSLTCPKCSKQVHLLTSTFERTIGVEFVFPECSLNVPWMCSTAEFPEYSLTVPDMSIVESSDGSLNVQYYRVVWWFPECPVL